MFVLNAYFCRESRFVAILRSKLRILLRNTGVDSDFTQDFWGKNWRLKALVNALRSNHLEALSTCWPCRAPHRQKIWRDMVATERTEWLGEASRRKVPRPQASPRWWSCYSGAGQERKVSRDPSLCQTHRPRCRVRLSSGGESSDCERTPGRKGAEKQVYFY